MDWLLLIGRVLFVLVFLTSGLTVHLIRWRQGVQYAAQHGVPAALVPLSGVLAAAGAVLLAAGIWPDLGALLLAAFIFPVALWMHRFWRIEDAMMRANDQAHFMKDIALGGAALALFAFFQQFGDEVGLTVTGPLF